MLATLIYGERDIRLEEVPDPVLSTRIDAIVRVVAACVCGSDLWPYRGVVKQEGAHRIGHEFVGIVESIGADVKKIKVGERVNLQFRTEFFNIFNHANFNNPSASVTSASFGRITQTLANASGTFSGTASPGLNASPGDPLSGGPRIIQFGLKLLF